ncbi:hypothetical protein J3A84_05465 [Proteiniclasticum sp. SCR006]|uniref:Uncharacterized protein n=1 Tax=Proteiniclasticum aestuarii TaxID=2817862 RepID=A0A939HAP4_9CLOT|nr:hypothetical protein [Proteiniclasticum aestuarii]MBO1264487.1 hypothetical protein [Proteiniclasticum aestuarii]
MKKINVIIYILIGLSLFFIFYRPDQRESVYSSLLVIVTSVSVLVSYMMYSSQIVPKLYVLGSIKDAKNQWSGRVMNDFIVSQTDDIEGIAYDGNDKSVILEIHNNGSVPATNIKIEYDIVTYIKKIKFGVDRAEILNFSSVILERVSRTIEYDYLPPGDSRSEVIFYVSRYPQVDIVVKKLISKEERFISSDTVILRYRDERFTKLGDNQDLLYLLGISNPDVSP